MLPARAAGIFPPFNVSARFTYGAEPDDPVASGLSRTTRKQPMPPVANANGNAVAELALPLRPVRLAAVISFCGRGSRAALRCEI